MKAVIVLAMHGGLPNDFPQHEMAEYMGLRSRLGHAVGAENTAPRRRFNELETRIRHWPRTAKNDPYYSGSHELVVALRRASGRKVILGFNEFCAPSLDEALDQAAGQKAEKVIVVTPMMTRGGEHAEIDIPGAIRRAESAHPGVRYVYGWPFPVGEIAEFLTAQISRFL
jgi:sirohydrochlorin cobaltochelatase